MEDQDPDSTGKETANRLHSVAIHLLRGLQDEDAASGLSRARLSALSVIVFAGPLRASRLARLEGVKPPTMTVLVQGLERAGLVRRQSDPADARATLLSATADGVRLIEETRARRLSAVERQLAGLTFREQAVIAEAATILARIYLPSGPPPPPDRATLSKAHQGRASASPRNRTKGAPS